MIYPNVVNACMSKCMYMKVYKAYPLLVCLVLPFHIARLIIFK